MAIHSIAWDGPQWLTAMQEAVLGPPTPPSWIRAHPRPHLAASMWRQRQGLRQQVAGGAQHARRHGRAPHARQASLRQVRWVRGHGQGRGTAVGMGMGQPATEGGRVPFVAWPPESQTAVATLPERTWEWTLEAAPALLLLLGEPPPDPPDPMAVEAVAEDDVGDGLPVEAACRPLRGPLVRPAPRCLLCGEGLWEGSPPLALARGPRRQGRPPAPPRKPMMVRIFGSLSRTREREALTGGGTPVV